MLRQNRIRQWHFILIHADRGGCRQRGIVEADASDGIGWSVVFGVRERQVWHDISQVSRTSDALRLKTRATDCSDLHTDLVDIFRSLLRRYNDFLKFGRLLCQQWRGGKWDQNDGDARPECFVKHHLLLSPNSSSITRLTLPVLETNYAHVMREYLFELGAQAACLPVA